MKTQIGFDAGGVWQYLKDANGESVSIRKLAAVMKKVHGMSPQRVHLALGWLAREDKVSLEDKSSADAMVALSQQEMECLMP